MKKTQKAFITSLVLLVSLLAVGITAYAYAGNNETGKLGGRNFQPAQMQEMMTAIENNDYTAWKALIDEMPMKGGKFDQVTEDNFAEFAQAHKLRVEGKVAEADTILTKIGITPGRNQMTTEQRDAIDKAITDNDYEAWVKLMENAPNKAEMLNVITKDNFSTFAKAHLLKQEAKTKMEEADEILTGLGVINGFGKGERAEGLIGGFPGGHMGRGMMDLDETQN